MPPKKLNPWQKLRLLVQKHKVASIIIAAAIIISAGFAIWLFVSGNAQNAIPSIAPPKAKVDLTATKYYSPLSGMEVTNFTTTQKQVRAIKHRNKRSRRQI